MKAHDLLAAFGRDLIGDGKGSDAWAVALEKSQKFDVSGVVAEDGPDPALIEFANELIYEGIFRSPFEYTYIESAGANIFSDCKTVGLIVYQDVVSKINGVSATIYMAPFVQTELGWIPLSAQVRINVPDAPKERSSKDVWRDPDVMQTNVFPLFADSKMAHEDMWAPIHMVTDLLFASIVAMQSKGTVLHAEIAPEKLNRKRKKMGKIPLFDHKVLIIGGENKGVSRSANESSFHSSPRMHWRRGHIRTLTGGRRVPVSPALVGAAENGVISHEYRVRRDQSQVTP